MNTYLSYLLILVVLISSCKLYDPDETTPSYIYIEDIVLNTKSNQGTTSDKIVDAWVFVNGSLIGTYELPSKIPIHVEGNYNLKIYSGIKRSGLAALRVRHEFHNPFDTNLNSVAQHIDTITPIVEYEHGVTIWKEDFEDPGIKFTRQPDSDTTLNITNESSEVFEGNGSGKIIFESTHLRFEAKTNEISFNSFPRGGNPVYLELDYKTNEVLTLGIYHNNNSTAQIKLQYFNLTPTTSWNKVYIDLREVISPQISATEFDIYLEVVKNRSSQPLVFVDNIQVIY